MVLSFSLFLSHLYIVYNDEHVWQLRHFSTLYDVLKNLNGTKNANKEQKHIRNYSFFLYAWLYN